MPTADVREAAPQVLDDRLAIDREADRLAHLGLLQERIAQVQPDVGVVGARRGRDSAAGPRAAAARRCPGDRSLTTRSTLPLRSSRPRIVSSGTTFSTMPAFFGAPP